MIIPRLASALGLRAAAVLGILAMAACGPLPPQPGVAPAAPVMMSLQIPSNAFGAAFSGITPEVFPTATTSANYFVLPLLTTTSPIVRVMFTSPYPSDLTVAVRDVSRGQQAVTLPQIASGSVSTSTTGFFQVVSVTPNNPATWQIVVRYPNSFQGSKLITTAISDVVGGMTSAPLPFSMSFRGSTLTVSIASENNDGRVTSNRPGIDCPGTCSADFLGASDVTLSQGVSRNQTQFTGWTASCIGTGNTGNTCRVSLRDSGGTGIPVNPAVAANFRIHTSTPIPPLTSPCPTPLVTGMRWAALPNCGTIATSQGATRQCDANGHFCCGVSGGVATPRCPGGNETAVTCSTSPISGGPNHLLIQPGGCYESAP